MDSSESNNRFFMSYKSENAPFVAKVCHCLKRQANIGYYLHEDQKRVGSFEEHFKREIKESDWFILFLTEKTISSKWQIDECDAWISKKGDKPDNLLIVNMNKTLLQVHRGDLESVVRVIVEKPKDFLNAPIKCSNDILSYIDIPAAPFDDLPIRIVERYEKDLIMLYRNNKASISNEKIRIGYPSQWPSVRDYRSNQTYQLIDNPLPPELYGKFTPHDSAICVDARFDPRRIDENKHPKTEELTFPEAGPRRKILSITTPLNVAILVSGGIAPGINAVISAILDRHKSYEEEYVRGKRNKRHKVQTYGCIEGFKSLYEGGRKFITLDNKIMNRLSNRGGSYLPTARADQLLKDDPLNKADLIKRMLYKIQAKKIDILYVIGGEGSMRAAHALWTIYDREYPEGKLSVVGIPMTMDNDILWVWQSLGFLSAVEKARQYIIQLTTEAISNSCVGIMQLFGSSAGFVVSHVALGSNVCDLALIPELDFKMIDVCKYMANILYQRRFSQGPDDRMNLYPYGIIVMSETSIPIDFDKYMYEDYVGLNDKEKEELLKFDRNKRMVVGQTPDELSSACLKIVSKVLERYIHCVMGKCEKDALSPKLTVNCDFQKDTYWENFRVFTNEPLYLIRSMEPTISDVANGIRLGTMAVDIALAGFTDCMVSQWLTEYVVAPLKLVVLGRKRVPREGIFWKTVVSKTRQIDVKALT